MFPSTHRIVSSFQFLDIDCLESTSPWKWNRSQTYNEYLSGTGWEQHILEFLNGKKVDKKKHKKKQRHLLFERLTTLVLCFVWIWKIPGKTDLFWPNVDKESTFQESRFEVILWWRWANRGACHPVIHMLIPVLLWNKTNWWASNKIILEFCPMETWLTETCAAQFSKTMFNFAQNLICVWSVFKFVVSALIHSNLTSVQK